ncbi:MAG: hypothetical protein HDKAJFGB_01240 [Anaerolineae bacterium]|nr:hypothetical protein [Anaerolineae bacterium]
MSRLAKTLRQFRAGNAERDFAAARIAKAAGSQRNVLRVRAAFDFAVVHRAPVRVVKIHCHRAAALLRIQRSIHAHKRRAVGMMQRVQAVEQKLREQRHAFVNHVVTDGVNVPQTNFDSRDIQIIQRAILERRFAFAQIILVALHRRDRNRAAREPRTMQFFQSFAFRNQRADAGRITEYFIKRLGDKFGFHLPQVQTIRRRERGGVEQHIPTARVRPFHKFERMLDARKIGLRGERKQIISFDARTFQFFPQRGLLQAHIGQQHRHIRHVRAARPRKFADAVHRIVIIEREQVAVVRFKRIRFADEF